MLRELENPRQLKNEPFRRIFFSDYFDLFVWFGPENDILGFQLCYDVQGKERSITYLRGLFTHRGIDGGESNP